MNGKQYTLEEDQIILTKVRSEAARLLGRTPASINRRRSWLRNREGNQRSSKTYILNHPNYHRDRYKEQPQRYIEAQKRYRKSHIEKVRELSKISSRRMREKNPELIKQIAVRYKKNHPKAHYEAQVIYRASHPAIFRAAERRYKAKYPEKKPMWDKKYRLINSWKYLKQFAKSDEDTRYAITNPDTGETL